MTEKLYYRDSKLLHFYALVRSIAPVGRWQAVVLDRTAFHPTGGGQPYDTGVIAGAPVFEVVEEETSGEVLHFMLDRALAWLESQA